MSALHRHLTSAGSCAGLAYRHDCPRCRAERLAGTLPYPDGLLSQRSRALVLAAALGTSGALAPAGLLDPPLADAALGTEEADPDADDAGDGPTEEDTVAPEDGDPSHAPPITEPDGPSEDIDGELPGPSEPAVPAPAPPLPTDAPLPAPVPAEEAPPPVPAPPATEVAPPPPADAPPSVAAPPAPSSETVPSQPMPQPGPQAPPPGPQPPDDSQAPQNAKPDRPPTRDERPSGATPQEQAPGDRASDLPGDPVQPPLARTSAKTSSETLPDASGAPTRSDPSSGRFHVVAPGESLWSIAHDQIDPAASPAQVARLVNRLWTLNADRIGTGQPDLIHPGQRLLLP